MQIVCLWMVFKVDSTAGYTFNNVIRSYYKGNVRNQIRTC